MGHQVRELCDTALHEAVRFADIADVRDALLNKNDPNEIGLYQWAPVHEAAQNGELDILLLLLKHGGSPNVQDRLNGRTPLHYAAEEGHIECVSVLLEHGSDCSIEDTHGHTVFDIADEQCQRILKNKGGSFSQPGANVDETSQNKRCVDNRARLDVDRCRITSFCSSEGLPATPDSSHTPDLGQIELSFEYDSRKSSLRIRVWQISDIIIPPAHTSMISCIYVKSYLIPDKARKSKRKTEEVKVSSSTFHLTSSNKTQSTFFPVTFRFSKSLDYSSVTRDTVSEKTVQLEVCVTQKYSSKSFLISMYRLPCKAAVRQLVRKKYKLIPCNNPTLPDNMKVYSASQLRVAEFPHSSSNPDLRCLSYVSLNSESSGYPESKAVLEGVTVQRADNPQLSNIVISMPAEEDDHTTLFDVTSVDSGLADVQGSQYTSVSVENLRDISVPNEITVDTPTKQVGESCHVVGSTLVRSENLDDLDSLPSGSSRAGSKSGFYPVAKMLSKHEGNLNSQHVHLTKVRKVLEENDSKPDQPDRSSTPSKPDTPTWDDSDLDSENVRLSIQSVDIFGDSVTFPGSLLPLPTNFNIPCEKSSFSIHTDQTADGLSNTLMTEIQSLHNNHRTKHTAITRMGKGQDKEKKLVGKSEKSGRMTSADLREPSSRPAMQPCSVVDERMRSRERTHTKSKSVHLTEGRKKALSTSRENTILDIESDEEVYALPQSVQNLTIPKQVFITEDSD